LSQPTGDTEAFACYAPSVRRALRAVPTLVRVGLAEAIAYRAEMLVWLLSTTMPLVMLALMTAVARDAPVGRFGRADFTAYYLAALVVRLMTGAWVIWEVNFEIRQGTLAYRLLRPIHPLVAYAAENVGAMPLRLAAVIPIALVALAATGGERLTRDPLLLAAFPVALVGAWLITFLAMSVIGAVAFWVESSGSLFEVWLGLFGVFSGYLVPLELFPRWLELGARFLPFRYMLAFPVEMIIGMTPRPAALRELLVQWIFVAALALGARLAWRAGLRRFSSYGG
jgi:ABC-2 type transport system permease protein